MSGKQDLDRRLSWLQRSIKNVAFYLEDNDLEKVKETLRKMNEEIQYMRYDTGLIAPEKEDLEQANP